MNEPTRAILCVHQIGMQCDLAAILAIAWRRSLVVIAGAACATGSEICWDGRWERIGKPHGDIACFSFHPRKVISTGDGGMITSSDSEWHKQFGLLRQHGMSVPDTVRHGAKELIFELYAVPGYNYCMTDIQAAVGRARVKRLPAILERRRWLADRTGGSLRRSRASRCAPSPPGPAATGKATVFGSRGGLRAAQGHAVPARRDIATRRGIMSSHHEPAYARGHGPAARAQAACACHAGSCERLRGSERATERCILLPLFPQLSEEDQHRVVAALAEACAEADGRSDRKIRFAPSLDTLVC